MLVLHVSAQQTVAVGALGVQTLAPGWYAYCGSAQGPGGLRARVRRHLRPAAARHWHVDYLREVAQVVEVWIRPEAPRAWECAAAAALAALPGSRRAVPRFGSSDCRCPGHLIALSELPALAGLAAGEQTAAGALLRFTLPDGVGE